MIQGITVFCLSESGFAGLWRIYRIVRMHYIVFTLTLVLSHQGRGDSVGWFGLVHLRHAPRCGYCLEASMTGRLSWLVVCPTPLWIADQVRNDGGYGAAFDGGAPPCGYCLEASMTATHSIRPVGYRLRGNDGAGGWVVNFLVLLQVLRCRPCLRKQFLFQGCRVRLSRCLQRCFCRVRVHMHGC